MKIGHLVPSDYDLSNTEGDSGKTAVIKTAVLNAMTLVLFDPALVPYATSKERLYPGFN